MIVTSEEVIAAYQAGEKPKAIAKRLGVARVTVFRKLGSTPKTLRIGNGVRNTPEYKVWSDMRKRVFRDERAPDFLFNDFKHFLACLGPRNGRFLVHKRGTAYGPDTCRWGTLSEARHGKFDVDTADQSAKPTTHNP